MGILALRPLPEMQATWMPVIEALNKTLTHHQISPHFLDHQEMLVAMQEQQVDFLLSTPAFYILLNTQKNLSGAVATLITIEEGQPLQKKGGVIFTRADRADIETLKDLKGKKIATADVVGSTFSGHQVQVFEMHRAGLPPLQAEQFILKGTPQDRVAYAVLDGRTDAGFARTGLLESMARQGMIELQQFKIINEQKPAGFPFVLSTQLYPEWPVVALPHTDEYVARKITAALLGLELDHSIQTQTGIHGFGVPADYHIVAELMRELRIPPFEAGPTFTLVDIWRNYQSQGYSLLALILVTLFSTALLLIGNRHLCLAKTKAESAQRKLEKIYNLIPDAIFIHTFPAGRVLDCNQAACHSLGRRCEELLGLSVLDINPEACRNGEPLQAETLRNKSLSLSTSHQRADGSSFPVEVHLTTAELDGVDCVIAVARDITERKAVEKNIAEQRQTFELILEHSLAGYFDWRLPENTEYLSPTFKSMFGYADDELDNSPETRLSLIFQEDLSKATEAFQQHVTSHGAIPYYCEVRYQHKNGSLVWVICTGKVIEWDADGQPLRMIGCHIDITKLKETEQSLRIAMQKAEVASQAKTEFLGNMSHELRTPLNGILGMHQLLQMTELTETQREYLLLAEEAGQGMVTLVSDLLDLARIEAGRMEIHPTTVCLATLMISTRTFFRPISQKKQLPLNFHFAADIPPMCIDGVRLRQILLNLLGNAIKFTESGAVDCWVRLVDVEKSPCTLEIVVGDTGIGIAQENMQHIFEPFAQVEGSFSRDYQGAGLGLSIVKRLVSLMGGEIALVSTVGLGTQVTLRLPVAITPAEQKARAGDFDHFRAKVPLHVLLVEDNVINLATLRMFLTRLGVTHAFACDGRQALERLAGERFDLVLMDIQMPVMDGFEAFTKIRAGAAGERNRQIPVIAITAFTSPNDRQRFLTAGMNGCLTKPIKLEELASLMNDVHSGQKKAQLGTHAL